MSPGFRLGLVGPDQTQPCGIADYTARLREALAHRCDLRFIPLRGAEKADLEGCEALLVQYERSLIPDPEFMERLSKRHPRVFVVPHEIYLEDPFAFPYSQVRSAFPPLQWLKRARYRWLHRHYGREQALQALAYHVHRVIPLTPDGADILRLGAQPGAAERLLPVIPLAGPDPSEFAVLKATARSRWFKDPPRRLLGIFGFLNPAQDYGMALDLVTALGPDTGLLLAGGTRRDAAVGQGLEGEIARRGLKGRVRVTGYLAPDALEGTLRLCDAFLSPLKFKSNSSSILHLFHLGKPILVSDLPLTRFLREQGAPVEIYSGYEDLREKAGAALAGRLPPRGTYRWTFAAVADAYLAAVGAEAPAQ